jgi:hypothetical protein
MPEEPTDPAARLQCGRCRDVIGVYEPLVAETPTGRRRTSLTADPWLQHAGHACYHRACYEPTGDGDAAALT